MWPAFWLRGLPPRRWLEEVIEPHQVGDEVEVFGWRCLRESGVHQLPADALLAVDASGGHHTADPRLRRVTFGLVVLNSQGAVLGGLAGQVPGAQTVNRGELFATVLALELTVGPATVITDSAFVVKSFSVDSFTDVGSARFHLDLWGRLAAARKARTDGGLCCELVKVKSHRSFQQVVESSECVLHWVANELADGFAGWAAGVWCLPPAVVKEVEAIDLKTKLVQDRLAYITSTSGGQDPPPDHGGDEPPQDHRGAQGVGYADPGPQGGATTALMMKGAAWTLKSKLPLPPTTRQ